MDSLEMYRQNAKKTQDPNIQWEFTKYLIATAESIDVEINGKVNEEAIRMKNTLLNEGVKWLKRLTSGTGIGKAGLPEAQFLLAEVYGGGRWGVTPDHDKAFSLYVQASKQNHDEATYRAAVCYELGAGTKKDFSRSVQFYRKAAALSEPASMYKLAMLLLEGTMGVQKNEREGITWLKRAAAVADEVHPESLHELAACYEKPAGMPGIIPDEGYAWELYAEAAGLGYAPSQYKLGHCYEHSSLGQEFDSKRSIYWYTKAAEQGDAEAELALSGWYLTGDEVLPQCNTEAYLWARKSAEQEHAKGEYAVGYYSEGKIHLLFICTSLKKHSWYWCTC